MTHFLNAGPADASAHILLAHGAGAAMTSPFLETITRLLTERHLQVSRFEFDYMAARREGGKRRPPPRAELLIPEYKRAVEELRAQGASRQKLFIGGKSLGGRVASLAAELYSAGHIVWYASATRSTRQTSRATCARRIWKSFAARRGSCRESATR